MTWKAPHGWQLGNPRPAITYRGAIRNLQRGPRRSHELRAARRALGLTSRQFDRLRYGESLIPRGTSVRAAA